MAKTTKIIFRVDPKLKEKFGKVAMAKAAASGMSLEDASVSMFYREALEDWIEDNERYLRTNGRPKGKHP